MIILGLVLGRVWAIPVGAVAAALLVSTATSVTAGGFATAMILGALNAAAGVAVRVGLRRCAGRLGWRRGSTQQS